MSEQSIEQEIQDKNLNAPRLTPSIIDARMAKVVYWTQHIPDTTSTIAVAFDENGFSIASHISASVSKENFDAELGKKIALADCEKKARDEMWRLEGYMLKRQLEK